MNLGFLDKSSNMTPLLVQLYDSQKLHALATDKKPVARAKLTGAVTELLCMDASPREAELVADILIELMRQAEIDLRQALSEKLSTLDNVPLRLILQIANDEIVVAHPVLKYSPVLSDLDLIYIIKSKTPEYWRSIAQRRELSSMVVNSLANTRDEETCINLSRNETALLTEKAAQTLYEMAHDVQDLAQSLSGRNDVPESLKGDILRLVGRKMKETGLAEDAVVQKEIEETVEELSGQNILSPTPSMIGAAKQLQTQNNLTIDSMISLLRRGQFPSFIAQFAEYTELDHKLISQIMAQKSGQGLALACKAADIQKYDFVSIFLLTHKIRSTTQMADVSELGRAVEYFNRVDKDTAIKILKGKQGE